MTQGNALYGLVVDVVKAYHSDLVSFLPTDFKNGISEANLTLQFMNAFRKKYPDSSAFLELPFRIPGSNQRRDKHIDGFAFNPEFGVFIESKRPYGLSGLKSVVVDCDRLINSPIINSVLEGFHDKPRPKIFYGLILAEIYQKTISSWFNGDSSCFQQKAGDAYINLLEKSSFASFKHGSIYDNDNYLWKNGEQIVGLGYAYRELAI